MKTLTKTERAALVKDWPHTPRGKLMCPDCGQTGYSDGPWIDKHVDHVAALCGAAVSSRGRPHHEAKCRWCRMRVPF